MKKLFLLLLFANLALQAQYSFPDPNKGNLMGGFGLTYIDDKAFYAFRMQPELSLAKFGIGMDLNLEFDAAGKLRKENFNDVSDYLSIIRYVRYGSKKDDIYVRAGAIDYYTLGHGSIMYNYNNSPSADNRKLGIVLDLDFGKFGFESIYSDFSTAGVAGLRGYIKPLQFTAAGKIPIIGNLEVGASFAGDFNKDAGIISGYYDNTRQEFVTQSKEDNMGVFGLDLGLPVVTTSMFNASVYADYTKFLTFGEGASTGILMDFAGLGLVNASVKMERRWNSDKFIPAYFNALYEIERFQGKSSPMSSKAKQLAGTVTKDNGYFGGLSVGVANLLNITGSYQRLDITPNSGILHISGELSSQSVPVMARAGYDKINIKNESDMFTLDDRSFLFAETGYKPYPYLLVSMIYSWTYTPQRDGSDKVTGYALQKKVEPRVSLIYPFSVGGKK